MKKRVLLCCMLLAGSIVLSGCKKSTETSESQPVSATTKGKKSSSSVDTSELKKDHQQQQQKKEDVLKEFGKRWVNYDSIDERNASVKEFMTEECIQENGIDTITHAGFQATGSVSDVYESMTLDDGYIIFGTEETNGNKQIIVLNVALETTDSEVKISKLIVNYVRQAY